MQYHSLSALFFQSVWRERGERVGLCVWDEGGVGKDGGEARSGLLVGLGLQRFMA